VIPSRLFVPFPFLIQAIFLANHSAASSSLHPLAARLEIGNRKLSIELLGIPTGRSFITPVGFFALQNGAQKWHMCT